MTRGERVSRPSRLYVTWHRSVADNLDHAVTDEDLADGVAHQTGRYYSLCGREVPFDSCLVPPGRRCDACNVLVRLRSTPPTTERTCHRKPSRWRRLFGRLQTPAALPPRPPQRVRLIPEQGGRTTTSTGTGGVPIAPVPADHQVRRCAR
ncbi:hypothetical protein SAMN05421837_102834 [Amycolatopsis pretoriensis]|uniref:Uncharacterized protein n=1 Tax=Amycolatopsis pretoriensis TaxID=218821 RepID=A0A1H5QHR6_9PSEU|nr:hypothetical protein [Amycolatopsis pretoriensis]SEF24727.1 hypothetical protein SAMN05421837_102834 [Amycolatopsis pretoriensis]